MPALIAVDEYAPLSQSMRQEGWFVLRFVKEDQVDVSTYEVSELGLEVDETLEAGVTHRDEDVDIALRCVGSKSGGSKEKREPDVVLGAERRP